MSALTIAEARATDAAARPAVDQDAEAAPALRLLPIPICEPRAAQRLVRDDGGAIDARQGKLPLAVVPSDRQGPALVGADSVLDADTNDLDAVGADVLSRPVGRARLSAPAGERALREARRWAAQFVQAAVEVCAGLRPPAQLLRWTSEDVYATLARRCALSLRMERQDVARRAVVRSIRACRPCDGVLEIAAVVAQHDRVRAVALRMERLDQRWQVTALELG